MSFVQQSKKARRRVSIVRDGDDYVATSRQLGILMRHQSISDLRKACRWLQWDIEDANAAPGSLTTPGQRL